MSQTPNKASRKEGLLRRLARHSDVLFKDRFREQYAALCYQRHPDSGTIAVLLVTSRESLRWIVPKGWPIQGKKPHQVAAIEALEEAGVRGKIRKKPFGYFTYLKVLDNGQSVPCIVQLHLMEIESMDETFRERGQRVLEWVTCVEAARRVREPELRGLFLKLEQTNKTR
ncbi:NUDIX hydrolase [Pararhizobium sp. LjRoot255]|uniref:NUDIX hydrolase n=1 Tax=Pararhizobium sp. LjRoot255 TaxID=3342298 RepID=UPI003ED122C3